MFIVGFRVWGLLPLLIGVCHFELKNSEFSHSGNWSTLSNAKFLWA